jgi:glutamate synthase domain-containing protein 3
MRTPSDINDEIVNQRILIRKIKLEYEQLIKKEERKLANLAKEFGHATTSKVTEKSITPREKVSRKIVKGMSIESYLIKIQIKHEAFLL